MSGSREYQGCRRCQGSRGVGCLGSREYQGCRGFQGSRGIGVYGVSGMFEGVRVHSH